MSLAYSVMRSAMATKRHRQGGEACSAIHCSNGRYKKDCGHLSFFRFPRDEERCARWMQNSRRQDLQGKTAAELYKRGYILCSKHFEASQFTVPSERKRLNWNAVPTIFEVPNPPLSRPRPKKTQGSFEQPSQKRQNLSRPGAPSPLWKEKDPDWIPTLHMSNPDALTTYPPSAESMSEKSDLDSGSLLVYNSEDVDNDMNGSDPADLRGIQVKFEVDDPEYDHSLSHGNVTANLLRSFPPQNTNTSENADQWSGSSSVRAQLRKIMEDKSLDSSTAAQNVHNVIEDLLKRNEYLLAKNDAVGFKPHSRRGRLPGEIGRNKEAVFPGPGQSSTFSMGHQTQGRVMIAGSRSSPSLESVQSVSMGQLMRPKSPTQKCAIPERDKSHFNLALMESQVGCEEGEKIFRVQKHEMVCAISSRTKFLNSEGRLVSSVDINYYWCNFCNFTTTSKSLLMQHIMEHRFHCKHCHYQSFSRADVIHHAAHSHPAFSETAAITQYCTLLSDYLRVHHPKEAQLDQNRKRKEPPEDDGSGLQQPNKVSRADPGSEKHKMQKSYSADYDLFDISVEELESAEEEVVPHEVGSKTSSSSSSMTVVNCIPESASASQTVVLSGLSQSTPSASSSPALESTQPVITHIFSAATIPSVLVPETSAFSSSPGPSSSAAASASPSPPPLYPNSMGAGTMQQMRSNLYWSCGYCKFTSTSQSGIKEHSVQQHFGKPHRYVALIKTEDRSTPTPATVDSRGDSMNNCDHNNEREIDGEGALSDTVQAVQSDSNEKCQSDDPPVLIKQEPIEIESTTAPIKVRFPTPRNQPKESTALKCYHCSYSTRNLCPLRNHILSRHRGMCLVGLAGTSSKVFMCARSDCTFRSSSGQTYLSHVQECTPWTQGNRTDVPVEEHLVNCLQATRRLAEDSQTSTASASPASSVRPSKAQVASQPEGSNNNGEEDCSLNNSYADSKVESSGEGNGNCLHMIDIGGNDQLEPPDITQDEEDFGSLLNAYSSPANATAGSNCLETEADSSVAHPVCSAVYNSEMPHLEIVAHEDTPFPLSPCPDLVTKEQETNTGDDDAEALCALSGRKGPKQTEADVQKTVTTKLFYIPRKVNRTYFGRPTASSFGNSKTKLSVRNVKDVQCFQCGFFSNHIGSLKTHLRKTHGQHISFSFRSIYHSSLHLKCKFYACPRPGCSVYRYSEADVVNHYRLHHALHQHPYLSSTYTPAQVKFKQRFNSGEAGKMASLVQGRLSKLSSTTAISSKKESPFLCLYCDNYFYADSIAKMKAHHLSHHPGMAIIIRDVEAYRNKRFSRLSVCGSAFCDFITHKPQELEEHVHKEHGNSLGAQWTERSFQCASCGWITTDESFVREHVTAMHAGEGGTTVVTLSRDDDQCAVEEQYISV